MTIANIPAKADFTADVVTEGVMDFYDLAQAIVDALELETVIVEDEVYDCGHIRPIDPVRQIETSGPKTVTVDMTGWNDQIKDWPCDEAVWHPMLKINHEVTIDDEPYQIEGEAVMYKYDAPIAYYEVDF